MAWLAVAGAFGLVLWFGGSMPSQVVRTLHVGFLCLVAGAMIANHRAGSSSLRAVGWGVGARRLRWSGSIIGRSTTSCWSAPAN